MFDPALSRGARSADTQTGEHTRMNVSPLDLRQQRFSSAMRGFDKVEVTSFLAAVADDYEQALREADRLRQDVSHMEAKLAEHRESEKNLTTTLIAAQRLAQDIKANAEEEARRIIREAEGRSTLLLEKTQARLEDIQREMDGLKLKRKDVETTIEATIQALRNTLDFVREQDNRDREDKILLHRPRNTDPCADGQRSGRSGIAQGHLTVADFLIHNASEVLTCAGPAPRIGAAQGDAGSRANAVVAARDGTIVFVGAEQEWASSGALTPHATVLDARRGAVVPGFVDPHTHVIFAGDRRAELRRRLSGATYADIAAAGGGIVGTVRATREAPPEDLLRATRARLDEMLRCGTTTCEAKSGYGLTTESELKTLRVLRDLDATHPIDIAATFMGAHEIPIEYRDRRQAYVDLVIHDMIPAVAREGLAEWCDVFCEDGVFTPDESSTILGAARAAGLKLRIHADELGRSGGALVAAACGARSADHLIFVGDDGIDAMAGAQAWSRRCSLSRRSI